MDLSLPSPGLARYNSTVDILYTLYSPVRLYDLVQVGGFVVQKYITAFIASPMPPARQRA